MSPDSLNLYSRAPHLRHSIRNLGTMYRTGAVDVLGDDVIERGGKGEGGGQLLKIGLLDLGIIGTKR